MHVMMKVYVKKNPESNDAFNDVYNSLCDFASVSATSSRNVCFIRLKSIEALNK